MHLDIITLTKPEQDRGSYRVSSSATDDDIVAVRYLDLISRD